ncbi:MAG TPA: phosphatidate cytidylyltransferase [Gammaproteobacteria bacterium]|nr:phosphatidate cytidylyltransferase [Gammaproteobacteria bacterium]
MLSGIAQRVVTALVLAPVFIWAIFALPNDYFSYLLLAFVALGAWEFSRLIKITKPVGRTSLTLFIVGCALVANHHAQNLDNLYVLLYVSIAWWGLNLFWVIRYPSHAQTWYGSGIIRSMNGVLLLAPMWVALVSLHSKGGEYFLLLMLLIWGADSGAYFVGRKFGKRKLAPKVSPGKSIEGVVGGVGFALIVMIVFLQTQAIDSEKYLGYLVLAIVVSSVSVLGDLFESLFKRESGLKDSGQILPGHGGVLDRIDSLTAAAPFFLLGLITLL